MRSLLADVVHGLRGIAARPLLALVAITSLALGMGVNTALYSMYHQVALRPLPVPEADRLVNLAAPGPKPGNTSTSSIGPREAIFSYPMFRDLEREQSSFEGIAAHWSTTANIAYGTETRSARTLLVSGAYFPLLRLQPALGRLLGPADDGAPGTAPVAVLAHDYWRDALGAPRDIVGRAVTVNGRSLTIVGVAPAGFDSTSFGIRPAVYVPIAQRWDLQRAATTQSEDRTNYWVYLFARLKPGVDMATAETNINGPYSRLVRDVELPLNAELDAATREAFVAKRVVLAPGTRGQSTSAQSAAQPLALLLAAAALVLIVACLNIANLLLARGAARAGELAIRASLGASRRRLVRQLLVEAALLALIGALASLPLSHAAQSLLAALLPMPGSASLANGLDATALRFTVLAALATVVLFGLFPALQLSQASPMAVLRGASAQGGVSRTASRFRGSLAVLQVTVSMASLVLAALFMRSLINLQRVELGMDVERVAAFWVAPERSGIGAADSAAMFDRLEVELAAIPGVTHVASSLVPLLAHDEWSTTLTIEGHEPGSGDEPQAPYNSVGPGYFDTLAIPLLAGRDFTRADAPGAPKVAVVNRRFVERFGLGTDAIGKRFGLGESPPDIEIIGIAGDSKYDDVRGETPPQFFLPRLQQPELGAMGFYLRTAAAPEAALAAVRAAVARVAPGLPVEGLATMPQQIDELLIVDRFTSTLAVAFATLATLLAALGLYGVLSYTLAQRMREIGLRLALGASPRRLRKMVLGQVGRMTVLGGALGLIAALLLGRAARTLLFELDGSDAQSVVASAIVLAAVALAASWLPLRRVARIDPVVALRHD